MIRNRVWVTVFLAGVVAGGCSKKSDEAGGEVGAASVPAPTPSSAVPAKADKAVAAELTAEQIRFNS